MTTTPPTPKTLTRKTCSSNWCALKSVDILGQMQNNIWMLTSNAGGAHHVGGQLKYTFVWMILSKKTKPSIGNLDQHTNEPHLPPLNTCLMISLLQVFNGGTGDWPFLLSPPSLFLHYKTMITVRLLCRKKLTKYTPFPSLVPIVAPQGMDRQKLSSDTKDLDVCSWLFYSSDCSSNTQRKTKFRKRRCNRKCHR